MELVYLWVEDYKNIHKQGFNFSPRFECTFHDKYDENGKLKDNCKLEICDKKKKECKDNDYIENFFGDNINVTAIIGKNGSGKSNLLELLFYVCTKGLQNNKEKFFIVYFCNKQTKFCIGTSYNFEEKNIDKNSSFSFHNCTGFDAMVNFHHSIYFKNFYEKLHLNQPIVTVHDSCRRRHDISLSAELKTIKQVFDIQVEIYLVNNIKRAIELLKMTSIKLPNDFSKIKLIRLKLIDKFKPSLSTSFNKRCEGKINNLFKSRKFGKLQLKHLEKEKDNFLKLLKEEYTFEELSFDFIDSYLNIIVETEEFLDFEWQPSLSSGEETLLFQFAKYYDVMKEKKVSSSQQKNREDNEAYTIYIDEGENSLHPNWQKKYISYIVQFFKDNFPKNEIHIILTSHSPFLLSDIPKQNIIFLDRYKEDDAEVKNETQKEGNCKVLTHDEVLNKKQTFGANIHTLLSDSFFMEDGLMGEFAESKIKEIINFHKEVEEENKKERV